MRAENRAPFLRIPLWCRHGLAARPRGSAHPVAAVDIVGLGDDVIALGGSEEDSHAGQVRSRAHATVGNGLADQLLLLAGRPLLISGEKRVDAVPMLAVDHPGG